MRNKMMARAVLTLLATCTISVGLTTSSSAATCTYNGCAGKDPETTGCNSGATTVKNARTEVGYLAELRYSSTCKAVWTRISGVCLFSPRPYLETGYADPQGRYHRQAVFIGPMLGSGCTGHDNPPTITRWTPMSSASRERMYFGADEGSEVVTWLHTTACNDCTG